MSLVVALALAASLAGMLERRRRRAGELDLEGLVLVGATWLAGVGMATTLLAMLGWFHAPGTSAVAAIAAAIAWPWGPDRPRRRSKPWRSLGEPALVLAIVAGGLALRWPPSDYPLAGRDQGTYALRAQATLRTGELGVIDPVLAAAGREAGQRAGFASLGHGGVGLSVRRGRGAGRGRGTADSPECH